MRIEVRNQSKASDMSTTYRLYENDDYAKELGNNYSLYSNGVFVESFKLKQDALEYFGRLANN